MRTAEQEERGAGALKLFTIIKKALILNQIEVGLRLCLELLILKVVYIGSIGAGAERLVQETEKLVVGQENRQENRQEKRQENRQENKQENMQESNQEKRPEHLQERKQLGGKRQEGMQKRNQEQKTGEEHLQERRQMQEQRQESKQELQERRQVLEQRQEQEHISNVAKGGQVGTIDKKEGNGCLAKTYLGEVGGEQKVENEAESKTDILRSKEEFSEASSSDKEKEEQEISETETSRGEQSIKENNKKDEKPGEIIVDEDLGRPYHLEEGVVSKDTNDEEDEDIMKEIEDQLMRM